MKNQSDHNELKEQLNRYLSGKMSDKEAHDFEKRALNDPFLSEALDGFDKMSVKDIEEDLDAIVTSIEKKKNYSSYFAVAASVILLISVSFFVWDFFLSTNSEPLVSQKIETVDEIDQEDSAKETIPEEETENTNSNKPIDPQPSPDKLQPQQPITASREDDKSPTELGADEQEVMEKSQREDQITLDLAAAEEEVVMQEEVISEPIPEEAQSLGRRSYSAPASSVQKSSDSFMSEDAEIMLEDKKAQPTGGFDAFNAYVEKNRHYPDSLSGTVRIELWISEQGELSETEIIESPSEALSEEAIRLIKAYPAFEPEIKSGQPVSSKLILSIVFP